MLSTRLLPGGLNEYMGGCLGAALCPFLSRPPFPSDLGRVGSCGCWGSVGPLQDARPHLPAGCPRGAVSTGAREPLGPRRTVAGLPLRSPRSSGEESASGEKGSCTQSGADVARKPGRPGNEARGAEGAGRAGTPPGETW